MQHLPRLASGLVITIADNSALRFENSFMRVFAFALVVLAVNGAVAEPLTATKAEQLCRRVESLANAGEIGTHSLKFRPVIEAEQNAWRESHGSYPYKWSTYYLS